MSEPRDLRLASAASAPAWATREEWSAAGVRFAETQSTESWAFADWLKAGVDEWGEDAAREAAERSGISAKTVTNYLAVATAYPTVRRRTKLTFCHHLEVARLTPGAADALLDRAVAEAWPVHQTREAARDASVTGESERLRRDLAKTRRQLKAGRIDPADAARRARSFLDAERRLIRDSLRRLVDAARQFAASGTLDRMHGNARRGVARDMRRLTDDIARDMEGAIDDIGAAADAVEGIPPETRA